MIEKGKPVGRQGRKAMGPLKKDCQAAGQEIALAFLPDEAASQLSPFFMKSSRASRLSSG
jgi:hypothetical protein